MSEKLKINITIAEREYPLTINPEQEEGLQSASQKIETMIKQFEQNYAVKDKQDLLAMCALQFATQVEHKQSEKNNIDEHVIKKLEKLDNLLENYLQSK